MRNTSLQCLLFKKMYFVFADTMLTVYHLHYKLISDWYKLHWRNNQLFIFQYRWASGLFDATDGLLHPYYQGREWK